MIHLWVAMSVDSDNLRISLEQIHSRSLPNRVLGNQTESEQKKKNERFVLLNVTNTCFGYHSDMSANAFVMSRTV